jgi:hypothetical protein
MRVSLPANILQVNEIRRVSSNKIVVIGMFNGDVWSVAIVSLHELDVTDNFLCYEPVISPDGKYIAFIKVFPPHGAQGTEDHYMLYSLTMIAAQNRPAGVSSTDIRTVGFTIYPFGVGNKEFDNLNRPESAEHSLAASGFFWSPNSDEVVFADSYKGQTSIIVVQIGPVAKATTLTATIPATCSDNLPEVGNCPVRLVKVRFGKDGSRQSFTLRGIRTQPVDTASQIRYTSRDPYLGLRRQPDHRCSLSSTTRNSAASAPLSTRRCSLGNSM